MSSTNTPSRTGTAVFGPEEVGGRPVYRYLLTRELRGDGPPFVVATQTVTSGTAPEIAEEVSDDIPF